MTYAGSMMESHPEPFELDAGAASRLVESAVECAQACTACADACLAEENVADLRRCIRTDLDCADITHATARVLSRQAHPTMSILRGQVEACAVACRTCAEECESHASMHEHCRVCAEACRRCEDACEALLEALSA